MQVYFCTGTDEEKLEWLKIINIAGEKLTAQELRNIIYTGSWLADAKLKFSKSNTPAKGLAEKYVMVANSSRIPRNSLKMVSGGNIEDYMSKHQYDQNANKLWLYFRAVIEWVENTFTKYSKEIKDVD